MPAQPYALTEITLTIDGAQYECAITGYDLQENSSTIEWATMCPSGKGSVDAAGSYTLELSGYNDWHPGSLSWFLQKNAGKQAAFTLTDNGLKATGTLVVKRGGAGGKVNTLSEFTVTLPVVGVPTITEDPASLPAAGVKGAVQAGDRFYEPTITASDAPNAAKLAGLGYTATGAKWAAGKSFSVSGFAFHWSGTAFAAGASS